MDFVSCFFVHSISFISFLNYDMNLYFSEKYMHSQMIHCKTPENREEKESCFSLDPLFVFDYRIVFLTFKFAIIKISAYLTFGRRKNTVHGAKQSHLEIYITR